MNEQQLAAMRQALKRAFRLGQDYWSWADSEYSSHWKKADNAKAEFDKLVEDTTQPAQPAPVQEPPDDGFTQALIERDEYHAIADELAEMIARITGEDIGEHTSANFPWRNALDAAENWLCHPPAAQPAPVQELVCVCGAVWQGQELVETPAAQRQWVGLTDDDIRPLCKESWVFESVKQWAEIIEAKLKEKNT